MGCSLFRYSSSKIFIIPLFLLENFRYSIIPAQKFSLFHYFSRKSTNYHEMPVERRNHIPFFFWGGGGGAFNRTCTSVMLTRSEKSVIFYNVFCYFILKKPNVQSFSLLVGSPRGNLRDVRSRSTAQASESAVRSH